MPKRSDLQKILLLGSGPIVIGQACEFDYSGVQGAKSLRDEGYDVVLVNSNPATIMTDPEFSQRTYIEPLVPEALERVIEKEKPDALLPTLGGQTALNLALALERAGTLDAHQVELIGAKPDAIDKAENRERFKMAMESIGLPCPKAFTARTLQEAADAIDRVGYPAILRPSFTMGGSGGGIAYNREEFDRIIHWAFQQSPTHECLIEQSVLGWKEFELEVIRDRADNFAVICTIENLDPMGVHTGDSITVAPAMTLTDREYQRLRNAARDVMSEIGVETGGSNVQFGVNPDNGDFVVIEMNPRVSRSSALASKATGYPIAKVAAKLAVGFTLDELTNEMTGQTAAFEPVIDYVVTKVPRFAFEKFKDSDPRLTTQMKSVGEAMALGGTFQESLHKALQSLEVGRDGLVSLLNKVDYRELANQLRDVNERGTPLDATRYMPERVPDADKTEVAQAIAEVLRVPLADRIWYVGDAFRAGLSLQQVHAATSMDPWFLQQIEQLVRSTDAGETAPSGTVFAKVDTCAAEYPTHTNYFYSRAHGTTELQTSHGDCIMILGGGPNRIGQGIEFDYCCVHAAYAAQELGMEAVMVNCNPETVSTDYDTSTRLYFEPLTFDRVMAIVRAEQPKGVIVQLGGQTPLRLAVALQKAGAPIIGTSADAIDRAEDRERFENLLEHLNLRRPKGGIARGAEGAFEVAERVGFPVVVRPSYVLGGRAMEIVHSRAQLTRYMREAVEAVSDTNAPTILVDQFLGDAIEVDVDCVADGKDVVIGGIMQHIEEAGVHSGDSSLVLPAHALPPQVLGNIRSATRALALELGVVGLMNVQYAVQGSAVYVIEVNPRASRTVPFVSKAIGHSLARIGAKVMMGKSLRELNFTREVIPSHVAVKESVFPFHKFSQADTLLGPEMRSTGEVMGIGRDFAEAFHKAQLSASSRLPEDGTVFMSVKNDDKPSACDIALRLSGMGYNIVATAGTLRALEQAGVRSTRINKVTEGQPHVVDSLRNREIHMVINTTEGEQSIRDSKSLRRQTLLSGIPYFTTVAAATAAVNALEAWRGRPLRVAALQDYHPNLL